MCPFAAPFLLAYFLFSVIMTHYKVANKNTHSHSIEKENEREGVRETDNFKAHKVWFGLVWFNF